MADSHQDSVYNEESSTLLSNEQTEESQAMPIPASSQPAAGSGANDDLFGSDDEEAPPKDDLFGDGDEEEVPPSQGEGAGVMDEDLFGADDDADGVQADAGPPKKTKVVEVRDGELVDRNIRRTVLKLPNVLSIDPNPFDEQKYDPASRIAFREVNDMENHKYVQLENAENYIRFRFQKDKKGDVVKDANGRPLMESNARLVEYEDGSVLIFVGKECFRVTDKTDPIQLYEDRSKHVKVFQSMVDQQLMITPMNLSSQTHMRLKNSQINKVKPARRVQLQLHGPEAEKKRLEALGIQAPTGLADAARPQKVHTFS